MPWNTLGRVAPARERGLKFLPLIINSYVVVGRSREGAWIEIMMIGGDTMEELVAPARERGLKFEPMGQSTSNPNVAPARERGLK